MDCRLKGLALVVVLLLSVPACASKGEGGMIEDGKKVKFHYELFVDGEMIQTSQEGGPMEYVQGDGKILPALASSMAGLRVGDKREVSLDPGEAYGEADPTAIAETPKSRFNAEQIAVGQFVTGTGMDGRTLRAMVKEVRDETVLLDFNHPLAGKALSFKIEVVEIV